MSSKNDSNLPPDTVRPYLSHGIDLDWESSENPIGQCPFCDKIKFAVSVKTGMARCWTCGISETGIGLNASSFIRLLHARYLETTTDKDWQKLADNRKLYSIESLKQLGIVYNGSEWLIPGYNREGLMTQLYRYTTGVKGMLCLPTPTLGGAIFGMNLFKPELSTIDVVEGVWDLACWLEVRENANVIGIPGVLNFKDSWLGIFSGKHVNIMFDNDHPTEKDGKEIQLGGKQGTVRTASMLLSHEAPPMSVNFLKWGPDGYSKEIKNKTDIRDVISGGVDLSAKA